MNFFKSKFLTLLVLLVSVTVFLALTISVFDRPAKRPAIERVVASNHPATTLAEKICQDDFNRDLKFGLRGDDVKELQKYLNNNGFIIAKTGAGSPGRETIFFGALTRKTLAKFQAAKNIAASYGVLDAPTRSYLNCRQAEQPLNEPISQPNIKSYTIGGTITGITDTIVLQNNKQDDLIIRPGDNSGFVFPTALINGQSYVVTIKTHPSKHACYINNGAGIVDHANINTVKVACGTSLSYNPFIYTPVSGGSGSVTYTLTYTAGAGGSITGSASQTVNSGSSGSAVTAVASANYSFVNWSDDSTANPRTDTNVTANKSVTANFTIDTFTITSSTGEGGTISPLGVTTKDYGSSQTYTITPGDAYSISDVFIDSQSVGTPGSYEFTDISANHTIQAAFTGGES